MIAGYILMFVEAKHGPSSLARGFYKINETITGVCLNHDPDPARAYLTDYTADCNSDPPSIGQELSSASVNTFANGSLTYTIEGSTMRTYNVWCSPVDQCYYYVMYELNVVSSVDGLSCNLTFARDTNKDTFQTPDRVQWLVNGAPLKHDVSADLKKEDFKQEAGVLSYSFPLSFGELGGHSVCLLTLSRITAHLGEFVLCCFYLCLVNINSDTLCLIGDNHLII